MRKTVLILYTGGTIGMTRARDVGAWEPMDFDNIYQEVPLLKEVDVALKYRKLERLKDSSDFEIEDWVRIAKAIDEEYDNCDGFVVMHGTDTMAYTTSALSFMFENIDKPIIFTGSQLPIKQLRSDGRDNLINAIEIAAYSPLKEIGLYFNDQLIRGNCAMKYSAEDFNAFKSPNLEPLATLGVDIKYNRNIFWQPNGERKLHLSLDSRVGLLKLFPSMPQMLVENVLLNSGLKGVVLETFGTGNTPTHDWMQDLLKKATEQGVVLLNVSQCQTGQVRLGYYATSEISKSLGIVDGKQMTTESAITKMMYLLGRYPEQIEKIKELLSKNLRGEIN